MREIEPMKETEYRRNSSPSIINKVPMVAEATVGDATENNMISRGTGV
ncbi:MAG: hypothetical protein R3B45_13195 [Bdellovibrionota bacterium]